MLNLSDFKEYHKNPRKISTDKFDKLGESLDSNGDLGGIVLNRRTNELIGGNQRVKRFLQERERFVVKLVQEFQTPQADGTVGVGYLVKDEGLQTEQRFAFRVVDWDDDKAERANIQANKIGGAWDFDILANNFDTEKLLDYGFTPIELGIEAPKDPSVGNKKAASDVDAVMDGETRQLILHFRNDEFDSMLERLNKAKEESGSKDYTDTFLALLFEFENRG